MKKPRAQQALEGSNLGPTVAAGTGLLITTVVLEKYKSVIMSFQILKNEDDKKQMEHNYNNLINQTDNTILGLSHYAIC